MNDEDLSFHRRIFYDALWSRVRALPLEEAVLEVNRWCHEQASYQAQDERTASPLTVYRNACGRCGEESAFLVSALRSVGVPTRQVYVPRWSHCDDNHAWVEVLCGEQWRFLGACEPEPVLDRGWFNTAASRAVLIHSRTFGRGTSPIHGPLVSYMDGVALYNQTGRYAAVSERVFYVTRGGLPASGAAITLHILNEAHLHPVARLIAGPDGAARLDLGAGDLWVSASLDGLEAEGLCPREEHQFTLELTADASSDCWAAFDFRAPDAAPPLPPLGEVLKTTRHQVLAHGDALRQAKMNGWYRGDDPILKAARGNWEEIAHFLGKDNTPLRRRLLEALSPKDLRDITTESLEGFLSTAAPYENLYPAKLFDSCLLGPRVAHEGLTLNNKSPAVARVAELRARGIPARLRALDGAPEVWRDGAFHGPEGERWGALRLSKPPNTAPSYRLDWSLARRKGDGWQPLDPAPIWEGKTCTLPLPAGLYRLTTSARLPSGDQLAAEIEVKIVPTETVFLPLFLREITVENLLYRRALPPIPAEDCPDVLAALARPTLLFWLEEGGEPTEHILNELSAARDCPPAAFFLRGSASLAQPTLAALLARNSQIQVYYDDWAYDLEAISRLLGTDPERPPLAVVWDGKGRAVYAASGYSVGSVALLKRILRQIECQ